MDDQSQSINGFVIQQKRHLFICEPALSASIFFYFPHFHQSAWFIPRVLITCKVLVRSESTFFEAMGMTYSKLAKPELRCLSLSKKSETISLSGRMQLIIIRGDEDDKSRKRCSSPSARCELQRSSISPRYSVVSFSIHQPEWLGIYIPSGTMIDALTIGS